MKFYHYTAVAPAEAILSKGLSMGHIKHGDGSIRNNVVWLTTDSVADGHGLTTGQEQLTASNVAYLTRIHGVAPRNGVTMNKMRIRLTVDVSDEGGSLMPFVDYYARRGEKPDESKLMGLSAYVKNPWQLPLAKRRQLMKTTATKEGTWWLSFEPISPAAITRVEFNTPTGFVDYDFEVHGRRPFRDAGMVVPSASTLESLRSLVPCRYPFEKAKVFAFCVKPTDAPLVLIRGGKEDAAFDAVTGSPLLGTRHPNGDALSAWVREHSAELLDCWAEAVDVYYTYYPDAGTPRTNIQLSP